MLNYNILTNIGEYVVGLGGPIVVLMRLYSEWPRFKRNFFVRRVADKRRKEAVQMIIRYRYSRQLANSSRKLLSTLAHNITTVIGLLFLGLIILTFSIAIGFTGDDKSSAILAIEALSAFASAFYISTIYSNYYLKAKRIALAHLRTERRLRKLLSIKGRNSAFDLQKYLKSLGPRP